MENIYGITDDDLLIASFTDFTIEPYIKHSWHWLFGAIEKIESLGFYSNIWTLREDSDSLFYYCEIADSKYREIALVKSITSREETVYLAIIEFIKWYNKHPK